MKARALAGRYAGATSNLEAIARHYCGADVRVTWQPSTVWLGLARLTPAGFEILLNPYMFADDLPFVFHHECGHLVNGDATNVDMLRAEDMADVNPPAMLERLTPAERAAIGPVIDAREADADRWAANALRTFEGRFGPFLKAIR